MKNGSPTLWRTSIFFAWALIFGLWQPFEWWRFIAALVFLVGSLWSFMIWTKRRRALNRSASPSKPARDEAP